jgi:hypothetical protein
MNKSLPQSPQDDSFRPPPSSREKRRRIETQIHRRKKAKAVFPLEAEWNADSENPAHLKMSPDHMETAKKDERH